MYKVTTLSVFYLLIQGEIGTGIFGTPASVVKSSCSIGVAYILWVAGFIMVLNLGFLLNRCPTSEEDQEEKWHIWSKHSQVHNTCYLSCIHSCILIYDFFSICVFALHNCSRPYTNTLATKRIANHSVVLVHHYSRPQHKFCYQIEQHSWIYQSDVYPFFCHLGFSCVGRRHQSW